jgi:hypothetical protein
MISFTQEDSPLIPKTSAISVTNADFIQAIFKESAAYCHVTGFGHDPGDIPSDQHMAAWAGGYYWQYALMPGDNQYFTISTFTPDEKGVARRRKDNFIQTHCIVLDDVKEKLLEVEVQRLPAPSWILETSAGSEQWGYILDTPCTDRSAVENLLDGLVEKGLSPSGKDPGMKGVTRYVRLPEGYNHKASKCSMFTGEPYNCAMRLWEPSSTHTMESLAEPFSIDLSATRRESTSHCVHVDDHPLLSSGVSVKKELRPGTYDIICPWLHEHTDVKDKTGAAFFTNSDGTEGFKCHHGACHERNGGDLVNYVESLQPGFKGRLKTWRLKRDIKFSTTSFLEPAATTSFLEPAATTSFLEPAATTSFLEPAPAPTSFLEPAPTSFLEPAAPTSFLEPAAPMTHTGELIALIDQIKVMPSTDKSRTELINILIKSIDELPAVERIDMHELLRTSMCWTKKQLKDIVKETRMEIYRKDESICEEWGSIVFVIELNRFYNFKKQIYMTPECFQNAFAHIDADARKSALEAGLIIKVDKLDYAPGEKRIFKIGNTIYANAYEHHQIDTIPGDVSKWLHHWHKMGWSDAEQKHMLQWMAHTIKHPEIKINHMLILGGHEGSGKDFLLQPLITAMGHNSKTICGDDLLDDYSEYLMSTKHLNINETDWGDRKESSIISNKLKPICAAPPEHIYVNQKGISRVKIRNVVNGTMTTNSRTPIKTAGVSRRYFALWSELSIRDNKDNVTDEWQAYWNDRWAWMNGEGVNHCIHYLINNVDLSDFNPSLPPPMTDFLRNVSELSKGDVQKSIESMIDAKVGCLKNDIVSPNDIKKMIDLGQHSLSEHMYCDVKYFTISSIGRALNDLIFCKPVRTGGSRRLNLKIIRNLQYYDGLPPKTLADIYEQGLSLTFV